MSKKVLVAYATRYGSTREVAEKVADRLRGRGLEATAAPVETAQFGGVDAVVFGAPLYIGSLLKPGAKFLEKQAGELAKRPLAVFALGPLYATDDIEPCAKDLDKALERAGAQPAVKRVFVGAYDVGALRGCDKLIPKLKATPLYGIEKVDERDWSAVSEWADGLPEVLGLA